MFLHSIKGTVRSGSCLSDPLDLRNKHAAGIIVNDPNLIGSVVSFQMSIDGVSFEDVYDFAGTEYTLPIRQGYVPLRPSIFSGIVYLKIRIGSSVFPVFQSHNIEVNLITRNYL